MEILFKPDFQLQVNIFNNLLFEAVMKRPGEFKDSVTSRMYAVRVSSLKLLDEPRFGRRKYIELKRVP